MTEQCDVVVVGGGPAGAATAIGLARAGRAVTILERSQYDRVRVGETLPPHARRPLASLDVWNRFVQQDHDPSPASISVWDSDGIVENHFICNAYGHGWHLDRTRFDQMLTSVAVDCGARVHRGSRLIGCLAGPSSCKIEYIRDGTVRQVRTAFLVDATGRASVLARCQGATRIRFDRLIGIAGIFSPSSPTPENDCRMLVEAAADGWWYSNRLPQSHVFVMYMTDADLVPKTRALIGNYWRSQLDKTTYTRSRVKGLPYQGPVRVVAACSEALNRPTGHNWAATGDAAMSVDPLSGQGVCWALESGLIAARAIDGHLGGNPAALEELANWTRGTFDRYRQMHETHYSRVQRWPDSLFWRRRSDAHGVQARVSARLIDTAAGV